MGWTDSHLHQFISQDKKFYGIKDEDFEIECFEMIEENTVRLSTLLKAEKDSILYEYDFGDGWVHKIILEKILDFDPQKNSLTVSLLNVLAHLKIVVVSGAMRTC
jgi:hypothetical protein